MKAYKCDRCGKFFKEKIKLDGENFYITKFPGVPNSFLDLCPTCNDELSKWLFHTRIWTEKLHEEVTLDKIRAEIEELPKTYPFVNHFDAYVKEDDVKKMIDKYKAESEE